MESNPCLLIVLIMDIRRVREWNGEGYEAIVVIDEWEDRELSVVAEETAMQKYGPVAEPEEVEEARILLLHMVCAISSARKNEPADIADIDRTKMAALPGRTVPTPSKSVVPRIRVRKVRFVGHALNALNSSTHPAPDPLILAAKAAVVWSTRHDFRLAAGAVQNLKMMVGRTWMIWQLNSTSRRMKRHCVLKLGANLQVDLGSQMASNEQKLDS
jgi:hypothetical protein